MNLDAASGRVRWTKRLPARQRAQAVARDDRIWAFTDGGEAYASGVKGRGRMAVIRGDGAVVDERSLPKDVLSLAPLAAGLYVVTADGTVSLEKLTHW